MTTNAKSGENNTSAAGEEPASSNSDTDSEGKAVDKQEKDVISNDTNDDSPAKDESQDKDATVSDAIVSKEESKDKEATEPDATASKEESNDEQITEPNASVSNGESKDKDAPESTETSNAANVEVPMGTGEKITEPGNYDVLLGRGKPFQNHSGNQHMLQLVDVHRDEYNSTERASKNAIVERLIHVIRSSGGRFLERIDEGGNDAYWSEVPHATAYKKMSHALRSKHRTGHAYSGKKTKGQSAKEASKGNSGGVMGTPNNIMPPMMMQGFPMAGHAGFMGGPSSAMMMGNMMGMGPGGTSGMMANPMFQFEMQRAFFAQQEQMMQAQHRMWYDPSNNGPPPSAPEATGKLTNNTSGGAPGAKTGAAKKGPEKGNVADV